MKLLFFKALIILLLLIIFSGSVQAVTVPSKSYALPIGELKYVLTNWLEESGREVSSCELEMGKIDLVVLGPHQKWKIQLRPQSTLATHVTLLGDKADQGFLKFEEELWNFINAYLGPNKNRQKELPAVSKIPKIIASKIGAVVCISTSCNGIDSQFSGFIVDAQGTIICTAHDLIKCKTIMVTDQHGNAYPGKLVKLDMTRDLALIQSALKPSQTISLDKARLSLRREELLYAIGCPMNQVGEIIIGCVTDRPVKADGLHYWKVSIETSPGSSGSAVFDAKGVLVGMIKGRLRGTNTIGFLIPMDRIRAFVNEF